MSGNILLLLYHVNTTQRNNRRSSSRLFRLEHDRTGGLGRSRIGGFVWSCFVSDGTGLSTKLDFQVRLGKAQTKTKPNNDRMKWIIIGVSLGALCCAVLWGLCSARNSQYEWVSHSCGINVVSRAIYTLCFYTFPRDRNSNGTNIGRRIFFKCYTKTFKNYHYFTDMVL